MRFVIRQIFLFCLLFLFGAGTQAHAQDSVEGRLSYLLSHGLTDNPVIALKDEAVRRAQGNVLSAEGAFDWRTTVEGGLVRRRVIQVAPNGALTDDTEWEIFKEIAGGFSKTFRNGIEVTPGVRAFFGDNNNSTASRVVSQTDIQPTFEVKIPLLANSGRANVTAPVRAAQQRLTAAQYRKAAEEATVAHDLVVAYWRCVGTGERVGAEVELKQTMTAHTARQKRLANAGEIPLSAYLAPAADLSAQEMTLNEARRTQTEACRQLAAISGTTDIADQLLPRLPSPEQIFAPDASVEDLYVETALMQRRDIQALGAEMTASQVQEANAAGDKKPDLDLILDLDRVLLRLAASPQNRVARGQYEAARAAYGEARLQVALAQRDARNEVLDALFRLRGAIQGYTDAQVLENDLIAMRADAARSVALGLADPVVELDATQRLAGIRRTLSDAGIQAWVALADLQLSLGAVPASGETDFATLARVFLTDPQIVSMP